MHFSSKKLFYRNHQSYFKYVHNATGRSKVWLPSEELEFIICRQLLYLQHIIALKLIKFENLPSLNRIPFTLSMFTFFYMFCVAAAFLTFQLLLPLL